MFPQIQEGMVVYVCFFHGATEDIPHEVGKTCFYSESHSYIYSYESFLCLHFVSSPVIPSTADQIMTTKLFRKATGRSVSVLDLPGSVLFIPQDSLLGEPTAKRRVQYKGGCEPWRGAQLFSNLASTCRELMAASVKCVKSGVKVEQGVYGQKQEVVLSSAEPLTLLLEF